MPHWSVATKVRVNTTDRGHKPSVYDVVMSTSKLEHTSSATGASNTSPSMLSVKICSAGSSSQNGASLSSISNTCSTSIELPHSSVTVVYFFWTDSPSHDPGSVTNEGSPTMLQLPLHDSSAWRGSKITGSLQSRVSVVRLVRMTGGRLSTTVMVCKMAF